MNQPQKIDSTMLYAGLELAKKAPLDPERVDENDAKRKCQLIIGERDEFQGCYFGAAGLKELPVYTFMRDWEPENGKSACLLVGPTGTGKTFAGICWLVKHATFCGIHPRVRFYKATELFEAYQAPKRDETSKNMLDAAKKVELLMVDDLGCEPVNFAGEDFAAWFEGMFNERVEKRRITIITSNLPLEEENGNVKNTLIGRYGARFASRVHKHARLYEAVGEDLRRQADDRHKAMESPGRAGDGVASARLQGCR